MNLIKTLDTNVKNEQLTHEQTLRLPKFLLKLYEIVNDPLYQEFIEWTREGSAVFIKDSTKFTKHVLALFFKHKSFSSFIRQVKPMSLVRVIMYPKLNMYNFRKQKTDDLEGCIFFHPYFKKDQQTLLEKIKRKTPSIKSKASSDPKAESAKPSEPASECQEELEGFKKHLFEARNKIESIEKNVYELTNLSQRLVTQVQKLENAIMAALSSTAYRPSEQNLRHIHQSNISALSFYDRNGQIMTMLPKQFF